MKDFKLFLMCLVASGLLLTSCSKDDPIAAGEEELAKATLSFGASLNDLLNKGLETKQFSEFPECSDAAPATVVVVLSSEGVAMDAVTLEVLTADVDGDGDVEYFTDDSEDLELVPGTYVLEEFVVYDEAGNILWVAPIDEDDSGEYDGLVSDALPININLGAGVKKYVNVDVLCFDDREVNQYGYLFFDLIENRTIEFCVFGNYCTADGRHYPAEFAVSIWSGADDTGSILYTDVVNTVELDSNGDYAGTPVCFALPDTQGEDQYYVEITLLNSDAYPDVTEEVIRSFTINDSDVRGLFDGEDDVDYYHFREGELCGEDTPVFEGGNGGGNGECDPENPTADCDNDGVTNENDACPSTPPGVEVNEAGCDDVTVPGQDVVVFNDVNLFEAAALQDPDNVRLLQNLVNYDSSGERSDGNTVLLDLGRNSQCYVDGQCDDTFWEPFRSVISDEGFTVENNYSDSGYLQNLDEDIKVLFLVVPSIGFTVQEINALKSFAAQGGRIVFIGEHDGYYDHIPIENQFLLDMGAVLHNEGGALDCGTTIIPSSSINDHPIMTGITDITMACASIIEPGPNDHVLWYDTSGTFALAGVARIDTTPITQSKAARSSKKASVSREELGDPSSLSGY